MGGAACGQRTSSGLCNLTERPRPRSLGEYVSEATHPADFAHVSGASFHRAFARDPEGCGKFPGRGEVAEWLKARPC